MIPFLRPGSRLDRYALVRLLGRGGFGQVWEALRDGDGAQVAIKVAAGALGPEARLSARLRHRHLLDVYDQGEGDGWSWYAMELCPDGSLTRLLPLPPRAVVEVGVAVCEALAFAHGELGLVHADVKPDNLLVGPDGVVRLADLGQAVVAGQRARAATPAYASPEQRAGRPLGHESDLYALGMTLAVLATGTASAVARTVALDADEPTVDLTPSVPAWLEDVVAWATHPDPKQRPTASQLELALRRLEVGGASLGDVVGRRRVAAAPAPLVGRREALAAVLDTRRPAAITGPVGVGKSRLLDEAARHLSGRGHDVVRVDGGATGGVLAGAAEGLGLRGLRGEDLRQAVTTLLARRQAAVLADRMPDGPEGWGLLAEWHAAGVVVVAATRAPRAPDGWDHVPLGLLEPREGAELVRAVAGRRGVVVAPEAAEALSSALDGLPLAIELAASRLGVWTIDDLLRSHSVRDLRAPTDGGRGALEAALDSAWAELDGPHQHTLAAAALFVAGFSAEALEVVGGAGAAERLPELAARALALADDSGRWRLLEVVRGFASARATAAERARFVGWARGWAAHAVHLDDPVWPLLDGGVRRELPHLAHAVDVAREDGDLASAVALVEHVGWLHRLVPPEDGVLAVAQRLFADPRLSAAQGLVVERRIVRALVDLHHPDALDRARTHVGRARAGGTEDDLGQAELQLGMACFNAGRLELASEHYRRAQLRFPAGSVSWAHCLMNQGLALRRDYPRATELCQRALAVYRARRNVRWEVTAVLNLGLIAQLAGRVDEAREHYGRVLASPHASDPIRIQTRSNLGAMAMEAGDGPSARAQFAATIAVAEALGLATDVEMMRGNVAASWLGEDDDRAEALAAEVTASRQARPPSKAVAHLTLAHVSWRRGDDAAAWRHVEAARQVAPGFHQPPFAQLVDPAEPPPPSESPPPDPEGLATWVCLLWRAGRYDEALAAGARLRASPDKALFAHVQARFPRPAPR